MEYSVRTVLQRVTNRPHDYNRGDNIATTRSIYDDDPSRIAYHNAVAWRTTINLILHHLDTGDHDNMGNAYNIHDPANDNYYYCPSDDCPCNGSSTHRDDYWRTHSYGYDPTIDYDNDYYNPAYLAAYRDHLRATSDRP